MHNLLKHVTAMFPAQTVSGSPEGVEVDFDEAWPSITSAQVAELAKHDEDGITLTFRDDSRYYESCSIISHVLVIASPASAADQ